MSTSTALPVVPAACCVPGTERSITDAEAAAAASVLRALGDPHRVKIVNLLAHSADPICVCDFTGPLGLSQPTVSFHLKKLLDAGLVARHRRGKWAYYSLRHEGLERLSELFQAKGA